MRQLPGKPKLIRHRVSIANGAVIDSLSELFIFPNNVVIAMGEADGASAVTATAKQIQVAAGTTAGASGISGAAIRRVLPAGTTAGSSAVAGAAIRRAVATEATEGASGITGAGLRIVWTTGTFGGSASLVGVPTTRLFAPAWGNSSLTGEASASYVVETLTCNVALVTGLAGYRIVDCSEALAGASGASAIQGANLRTAAAACDTASSVSSTAQSILAGLGETSGLCVAQADTEVKFAVDGRILAGDGFDGDGNPLPGSTLAVARATTHAAVAASGGSRLTGSAPTAVAAGGIIAGGSTVLYMEAVICGAERLPGVSDINASAGLRMSAHALSVNLSYAVATANYGPARITGTMNGAGSATALATVAWNERPPR